MKRNWKFDNTVQIGERRIWKGDPTKIKAPWIKINESDWLGPGHTLAPGYHMIQKLSNLEWLEQQVDKNQNKL
jgi:hypothetical protein